MFWVVLVAFGVAGLVAGNVAYRWGYRRGFRRGSLDTPGRLGVRLRVASRNGTLIDADSLQLHYIARYGMIAEFGWVELFPGDGARSDIRVEIKAVVIGEPPDN